MVQREPDFASHRAACRYASAQITTRSNALVEFPTSSGPHFRASPFPANSYPAPQNEWRGLPLCDSNEIYLLYFSAGKSL